jgi:phage terminase small subunit
MAKAKRGTSKQGAKAVSTDTAKSVRRPTIKQRKFAAGVVAGKPVATAAAEAGYSPHSAKEIGYENLTKPTVRDLIEKACERLEIGPEYVLDRLKTNAERAMQHEAVRDREGNEIGEYVYQGAVANRALELIGKAQTMFTEKVEHSGAIRTPPAIDYSKYSDEEIEQLEALLAKQG